MTTRRGVAWLAIAAVAFIACGGGSSNDTTKATATPAAEAGIALRVPRGWTASDDGLTVAAQASDLSERWPSAARVRAVVSGRVGDPLEALLVSDPDLGVVDGPLRVTVARRDALQVTLRETGSAELDEGVVVRRYLATKSPTGTPVLFILEAREHEFAASEEILHSVPGWRAERTSK